MEVGSGSYSSCSLMNSDKNPHSVFVIASLFKVFAGSINFCDACLVSSKYNIV